MVTQELEHLLKQLLLLGLVLLMRNVEENVLCLKAWHLEWVCLELLFVHDVQGLDVWVGSPERNRIRVVFLSEHLLHDWIDRICELSRLIFQILLVVAFLYRDQELSEERNRNVLRS